MEFGRKTLIAAMAVAAFTLGGCSDVPEKHLAVKKDKAGEVTFHPGPFYEHLGVGTVNTEWDGRRVIDLPLDLGSKQAQHYKTDGGVISMDLTVNYCLGQSEEDRTKWFVTQTNAETQYPASVEGIVRSTVSGYTNAEVLNEQLAREHGKLPVYTQAQLDLFNAPINDQYGIDPSCYAVWPGNTSLLAREVQADLNRQRKNIIKDAKAKAQDYLQRSGALKATVDGEYAQAIDSLSPEMQTYLGNLGMAQAVKAVAKEKGQEVDVQLFVE